MFIPARRGGLHFRTTQQPFPACSTPSLSPQVTRELCNTCYTAQQVRWKRPHLPLSILSVHLHNIAFVPFGILMALSTDNIPFHWHFESRTVSQKISLSVQFCCWKTTKSLFYREMSKCFVLRHQCQLYSSTETCCWLFRWRESPLSFESWFILNSQHEGTHKGSVAAAWHGHCLKCVCRTKACWRHYVPACSMLIVSNSALTCNQVCCWASYWPTFICYVSVQYSSYLRFKFCHFLTNVTSLRTLVGTWQRKVL